MSEPSAVPIRTLDACERVIERGIQTFVEVGQALLEIRDHRLYREEYPTFEEYCKGRWGWSRDYANKQIRAAGVVENLAPIGTLDTNVSKPLTEAQVRPLTSLLPEDQRAVWQAAVETNGPQPTMKQVLNEVMRQVKAKLPPPPPRDLEEERKAKEYQAEVEESSELRYRYSDVFESVEKLAVPAAALPEVVAWMKQYYSYSNDWPVTIRQAQMTLAQLLEEYEK
jgi:hypothetical protein